MSLELLSMCQPHQWRERERERERDHTLKNWRARDLSSSLTWADLTSIELSVMDDAGVIRFVFLVSYSFLKNWMCWL